MQPTIINSNTLLLLIILVMSPYYTKAESGHFLIDGISYLVIGDGTAAVDRSSDYYYGNIVIPEKITIKGVEYTVDRIMDRAFEGCSELTSISIPKTIKSFGKIVFYGCSSLTSVTIPEGLITIPMSTFNGCVKLSTIIIPNTVQSIGENAFENTAWLRNQPEGMVYAGKVAYIYKGKMPENTTIIMEDGTLGIAGSAFYKCKGLVAVNIPNSVTNIGGYAFYACPDLNSVVIGGGVKIIGTESFWGCKKGLEMYCYAQEVPFCAGNGPFSTPIKLHVLEKLIKEYKQTSPWCYISNIEAIKDIDPKPGIANTTDIDEHFENTNINSPYYDLQGHMHKQPQKGIYIISGKKVIIK